MPYDKLSQIVFSDRNDLLCLPASPASPGCPNVFSNILPDPVKIVSLGWSDPLSLSEDSI